MKTSYFITGAMAATMLVTMAVTGFTIPDAHAQFQTGGVDKEGSWYAGEDLEQGDYFSYSMCHVNYKECSEFRLDLWVKGDIEVGSETKWLVEAVVYDRNRILTGQIEMGKLIPESSGGSDNLDTYSEAFDSSVAWLSAFATADTGHSGKGPKEFKATSWGKIANIGGEQVMPRSVEEIRVAGEIWETVVVGWRTGGHVSQIWVADNFPFPIKAKTYTHVAEGIPPPEYVFVLLDYMEDVKDNPFADVVPTKDAHALQGCETKFNRDVTVKKPTVHAMYQVHVFYGPEDPKQGCNMQWQINFISKYDETEFLNQVQFDVLVVDENQIPVRWISEEEGRPFLYSPSGQYLLDMLIKEEPGVTNYVIWVFGESPENTKISGQDDYVIIPITIHEMTGGAITPGNTDGDAQDPPSEQIPAWIKTNAKWWAEGAINDSTFVQGIQYMINQGIIQIPATESGAVGVEPPPTQDGSIPAWIKTNAKWWAEGAINDSTFVQGIQFLVQSGIIIVTS